MCNRRFRSRLKAFRLLDQVKLKTVLYVGIYQNLQESLCRKLFHVKLKIMLYVYG